MVDLMQFAPKEELSLLVQLIRILIPIVISALPVWLALKIAGAKKSGFIRVFIVNIIVGFISGILGHYLGWFGAIPAFILLLLIYKIAFKIGWLRAILVWVMQLVIVAAFTFILTLFGIAIL